MFSREGLRCGRSTIPSHKMVSRRCIGAMQPRMLLTVALVALLASARADEGDGSLLLGSVQGYMEQASKTVQDALSTVQESDIAVVARYAHWLLSCVLASPALVLRPWHRDCGPPSLPGSGACLSLRSLRGPLLGTVTKMTGSASSFSYLLCFSSEQPA